MKERTNARQTRYRWLLLPLLWMGLIFYASSMPYQQQNIQPLMSERVDLSGLEPFLAPISFTYHQSEVSLATHGVYGMVEFFIRKGAHLFVFSMLAVFWLIALRKWQLREKERYALAVLLSIGYAFIDEWHQSLTPNRTAYLGDVLLDATGVLLACFVVFIVSRIKMRRS